MGRRIIQNFKELAENTLRTDALALAEAGYAAIDVSASLMQKLHIENDELHINDATYHLAGRRIFFIGIGKCAIVAAHAIEQLFGDRLTTGIALDVSAPTSYPLKTTEAYVGTHPLPSEANERASAHIIELLSTCSEDDLILMLISGGGSTLICLPKKPMTCADEGTLWSALSAQGASIQDINTVRKHTSPLRGGGLAQAAYPAEVISLIISDVPGNDIGYIASGPTVRDTSTIDDAQAVLARYNIEPRAEYTFTETPKDQKYFERVTNTLFLSNQDALIAIKSEAERRGYTATIMSDHFSGEAREVGLGIIQQLHDAAPHTVLLYGGEATVKLGNTHGNGGRNQEMALAVLTDLHDDELLLPIASDGHDNSDHAGAIADTTTREHAALKHISIEDCFAAHNSYDFFTVTGDALITGYTGSNVSDIIIAIKN